MIRYLKNTIHLLIAVSAAVYYRFPGKHMTVIGVTGTDGKTSTSHIIFEVLKAAGFKVSLISTISAIINNKAHDTGFHVTTPSPWALQKFMKMALKGGTKYLVLEVTSHALDQYRAYGTSIDIAVITNISHEHLDYHKTLEKYALAKSKILQNVSYSVLNKDEANFNFLKKKASGKVITYALNNSADYTNSNMQLSPSIPGQYNLYNCLAAASVGSVLHIDKNIIRQAVTKFKGIPGRMEEIRTKRNFKIYIDFAHKPNALKEVLKSAKKMTKGKLIVVFGCAGLRDSLKRPMMGGIAAQYADYTVLTAEDPRTEDVRSIIDQIASGCLKAKIKEADKRDKKLSFLKKGGKYFWRIADRQEAINFVIRHLARRGDLILLCGKGHEQSMCYGKVEYPWDEKKAVEKALYGSIKITS